MKDFGSLRGAEKRDARRRSQPFDPSVPHGAVARVRGGGSFASLSASRLLFGSGESRASQFQRSSRRCHASDCPPSEGMVARVNDSFCGTVAFLPSDGRNARPAGIVGWFHCSDSLTQRCVCAPSIRPGVRCSVVELPARKTAVRGELDAPFLFHPMTETQ
jgi:hypothetical protein